MSISEGKLSPVHVFFLIPIAAASCAWLRPVTSWVVVGLWDGSVCLLGTGRHQHA